MQCLLESLLRLQHCLLLRHRDTRGLVSQTLHPQTNSNTGDDGGGTQISDEEIPSDLGSNEEGSGKDEDGRAEVDEERRKRRRRVRKRKCPWVSVINQ